MAKKDFDNYNQEKNALGRIIEKLRVEKNYSLRETAYNVKIPPSNLTYIERGINVPTADVYLRIVDFLCPNDKILKRMDDLYTKIRQVPPPDVCTIIIENDGLNEKIRLLKNVALTPEQLASIEKLFVSFNK